MKRGSVRVGVVFLLAALALAGSGCVPVFWPGDVVAFAAGWLARGAVPMASSTEITCYRNGVLIDCAEVPAELQATP